MGRLWFFYLIFSIAVKILLLCINFSSSLILFVPYFLLNSFLMSGIIFLLLDLPYIKSPPEIKKYIAVYSSVVYTAIVLITMLSIKLYLTIGSFLTFDLFEQVNDLNNFGSSIIKETDFLALLLFGTGIAYSVLSLNYGRRAVFNRRTIGIIFTVSSVLIFSSAVYSRGHKTEFHSIDRDPILELTSSALSSDRSYISSSMSGNNITKSAFSDSIMFKEQRPGCASGMNVVLFILESTTPPYLDPAVTPNILRLSGNGLVLNSNYTSEPATMKAVYSLFTGRFPCASRGWKDFLRMSEKDISFSQVLSSAGYYTEFVMPTDGRVYYEKDFLLNRFDRVSDMKDLRQMYPACKSTSMGLDDNTLVWYLDSFLGKHSKKKFFITLSSVNPHHPYDVVKGADERFGTATPYNMYRNALFGADEVIGKCYGLLEKYGVMKNTLFVIVSDHGEAFYQHKRNYLHSIFLYEENVHTIAMFINPVLFQRRTELNSITSHVDIAPTILDFCGIHATGMNTDGTSIFTPGNRRAVFYTSFSTPYWGCRDGRYKYILNRRDNSEELYDLENDKSEKNNISSLHPDICRLMNTIK